DIVGEPDLISIGLPTYDDEGEDMEYTLFDAAVSAIESIPRARRKDIDMLQEAVRRQMRCLAMHRHDDIRSRPLIHPLQLV
ncbi:hypothetical protein ACC745_39110, partial [Rhizobium ruizarguesonis]